MKTVGLIPRNRLKHIPEHVRVYHELCFFLHDECVRALHEYENAGAHVETIEFPHPDDGDKFQALVNKTDAVGALRELGYQDASKRVVLNTIRMAMISDCLLYVYEALRCFEKRKVAVGFNLLRKPLIESLLYFSWMCDAPRPFAPLSRRVRVPLEPPPPHRNGLRHPARHRHAPPTRRLPRHRRTTRLIPAGRAPATARPPIRLNRGRIPALQPA